MSTFIELVSMPISLTWHPANIRIGRTGRLGNEGLATSFYNDRDEPMAPFLAKILTENNQAVPDFLENFKPTEGEPLDFDDDSGDEENLVVGGNGVQDETNDDGWGAPPSKAVGNGGMASAMPTPSAQADEWNGGSGSTSQAAW